mmetsp:Transcript_44917/g.59627  ORF Transcript_44917/g.59627 Transcript_44917/m.59627 type:complete len:95 (-) Transcript_44917:43-327(-)
MAIYSALNQATIREVLGNAGILYRPAASPSKIAVFNPKQQLPSVMYKNRESLSSIDDSDSEGRNMRIDQLANGNDIACESIERCREMDQDSAPI